MHVKISDKGRNVLNDPALSSKVAKAILTQKGQLETGQAVVVRGSNIAIKLATSIKEAGNKTTQR